MPQVKNLRFSGRVGPVIFYFVGDKCYARSVPGHVKQTPNTKRRSSNFGIAARAGKALRSGLLPVLRLPGNRSMQVKFSGAIARWLALQTPAAVLPSEDIGSLYKFTFYGSFSFNEIFRVPISITRKGDTLIEINLPEFIPAESARGPAGTVSVECTFVATSCILESGMAKGSGVSTLHLPYNSISIPAQTIQLPFVQAKGDIIIIAASINFMVMNNGSVQSYDDPRYQSGSVLKSYYL